MAYTKINPLLDIVSQVFNPTAGSSSGSNVFMPFPSRSRLMEVGFLPRAAITSDTTMRVQIATFISSTASLLSEVISSTLGTFDSNMLVAGNVASATPPSPSFGNFGDTLMVTTSGGNSSLTGATVYALFRKA